jgi:hypothetical protein
MGGGTEFRGDARFILFLRIPILLIFALSLLVSFVRSIASFFLVQLAVFLRPVPADQICILSLVRHQAATIGVSSSYRQPFSSILDVLRAEFASFISSFHDTGKSFRALANVMLIAHLSSCERALP